MRVIQFGGVIAALGVFLLGRVARAEEATAAAGSEAAVALGNEDAPASGFMIQARMQAQTSLASLAGLGGGSGFLLGYDGSPVSFGVGVGLTRLGIDDDEGGESSVSLTMFQVMPTVMFDVWRSRDRRARANVVMGAGYGRASVSSTSEVENCTFDPISGAETCTTQESESSTGATLIPVLVGLGGDYFLSRHFALGVEAGLQAAFITGISVEEGDESTDLDASGNTQLTYGLLRATMVLGN